MKRMFALALALCMMLGAEGAMAEPCVCSGPESRLIEDSADLGDLGANGGTGCLNADMTGAGRWEIASDKTVHLCLHGKELEAYVAVYGTLNLYDCTGGGEVLRNAYSTVSVYEGGKFVLHSGTVRDLTAVPNDACVAVYANGSAEIRGGAVNSGKIGVLNMGDFRISGGSVYGQEIGVLNDGSMQISGGSIRGGEYGMANNGSAEILGGSIHGEEIGLAHVPESSGASLSIVKAEISKAQDGKPGAAMNIYLNESPAPLEESHIAKGSCIVQGAFDESYVKIGRIPAPASELPETGDASMLGAWVCLLGAAGMGLKLKKKH